MSDINYEIINQYLEGELSGEALLAFEREIKANSALAKEVAMYKRINDEMPLYSNQEKEEQVLTGSLEKLNEQYFGKTGGKVKRIGKWWYIAGTAAAAAAILIFVVRPFSGESFNNNKLFAYYVKDAEDLRAVQRGTADDTVLIRAADLYNEKDYKNALPLLQNISTARADDIQLQLALGVCYLQTEQHDVAINVFDHIIDGTTVFKYQAAWYKALALLKQNKLEECYTVLQSLPTGFDKYKEAGELMKKVDRARKRRE